MVEIGGSGDPVEIENFIRRAAEKGFHPRKLVEFCRREKVPEKYLRFRIKAERDRIKSAKTIAKKANR